MERVTRVVRLGDAFGASAFEAAFGSFRRFYGVAPAVVRCAPDVLLRYAALAAQGGDDALRRGLRHAGVPVVAAVLAPGTAVFEGEVDDVRMGDW